MQPTIVYLDADDEITSAAARIRAADGRAGRRCVLPFGSRVATSRINFRLLAREAMVTGPAAGHRGARRVGAGPRGLGRAARVRRRWGSTRRRSTRSTTTEDRDDRPATAAAAAAARQPRQRRPPAAAGRGRRRAADRPVDATTAARPQRGPRADHRNRRRMTTAAPGIATAREASWTPVVRRAATSRSRAAPRRGVADAPIAVASRPAPARSARRGGRGRHVSCPTADITVTPHDRGRSAPSTLSVTADPAATAVDAEAGVIPARPSRCRSPSAASSRPPARASSSETATGGVRLRRTATRRRRTRSRRAPSSRTEGGDRVRARRGRCSCPVAVHLGQPAPTSSLRCSTSEVARDGRRSPGPTATSPAGDDPGRAGPLQPEPRAR